MTYDFKTRLESNLADDAIRCLQEFFSPLQAFGFDIVGWYLFNKVFESLQ
jgi:hypothetical protein